MRQLKYFIIVLSALLTACSNIENATTEDIKKECEKQNWEKVKLMCEAYIKKDNKNPIVFKSLGDAYLSKKDTAFAQYSYQKAIELDSSYIDAIVAIAEIQMNSKSSSSAISMLLSNIEKLPEEPQLYNALGCAFRIEGNDNEAQFNFEKALSIDPNYIVARRNLGVLQMSHYELDDAILNFQTILDIEPKSAIAHNYLGLAYALNKNNKEAEVEFKNAIKCDLKYVDAYENLGYHYDQQNNLTLAKKFYEKAAKLGSENAKNLLKNKKFKEKGK